MLIPSHRHTAADLALWGEHEEADRIVRVPDGLMDGSICAIQQFAACGRCYVGCSWGKDSVVLLDALIRSGVDLPVVWVRMRGRDNPCCESVRDSALAKWPLEYYEQTFNYEDCSRGEHWRAVDMEFGDRRITGLRADESAVRQMSIGVSGVATRRSCRPLAYWRCEHIFAWAAQNNLPMHPAYAMLGGGRYERRHLRTHGIGGKSGASHGRREWEREYYPDILARLASKTSLAG